MKKNTIVQSSRLKNRIINSLKLCFSGKSARGKPKQVLMIMGCQRSGTTLFSSLFDEVYYARVFEEKSLFSLEDTFGYRLDTAEQVRKQLLDLSSPLVVMKPLVESQKALYWLEQIPGLKIVWLYRDYLDTSASNLKKFGPRNGAINNIRPFVDREFAAKEWASWNAENASQQSIDLIKQNFSMDMSPVDAAVLFWYVRNVLYFDQQLESNPNVTLIKYEEFVQRPAVYMERIFDDMNLPKFQMPATKVDTASIKKGSNIQPGAAITELAESLSKRLDDVFYSREASS